MMIRPKLVLTALAAVVTATALNAGQLKTPTDWKWRMDTGGSVVSSLDPKGDAMTFVAMPPGWHITTGPAALLYHPDYAAKGNFSVEAEIFLFPGESQEEYGVFLGGRSLDSRDAASYVAFVGRRDGKGAIIRQPGKTLVVDWKTNDGILPHPGGDATAKNVLRVDVNATDVVFHANGKEVATIPREGLTLDGAFGFRIGQNINIHASRLDLTQKLAPVPVKK